MQGAKLKMRADECENEMGREDLALPATVRMIVEALCADFDRRREAIRIGGVKRRTDTEFRYLNAKIINACSTAVGDELYEGFIYEIGARIGYAHSELDFLSESTYKKYKRRAMCAIARELHLVD